MTDTPSLSATQAFRPTEIAIGEVIFRSDLYPRIETSPLTVQKYAEDLDVLPPIEVNQRYELIDGWHRWTAHKRANGRTIRAFVTETKSDAHLLELAIERNAKWGLQLSQEDKRDMARRIYGMTLEIERADKKKHLAKILSVTDRVVSGWLSRMDKDAKKKRNRRIFELWLSCHTQEEIAETVGCTHRTVGNVLDTSGFGKNGIFSEITKTAVSSEDEDEAADDADEEAGIKDGRYRLTKDQVQSAEHDRDFQVPFYNVWKQQEKTTGSKHFGNSEVRWVDNLLYLYTKPFDIVIDPFAGGGSTIDICKKRLRRYYVSDRKITRGDIREHDLTAGLSPIHRWNDVKLVYLDPPYWAQAAGEYSEDATDLANMPLEEFTKALYGIISGFSKKLSAGAVIALLMQPTQWRAPDRQYTDHVADMIRAVKLPIDLRVQCPYESQQCTAQMVDWAKENRKVLVLSRELVIWRVP
jgi:hypothetical protein